MYFPYFYGRQSEFLALRDIVKDVSLNGTIVPVIEPVRLSPSDLIRCIKELGAAEAEVLVIVNPSQGDFEKGVDGEKVKAWRKSLDESFAEFPNLMPTYMVSAKSSQQNTERFFVRYPDRPVGLIFAGASFTAPEIKSLASKSKVKYCGCFQEALPAVARDALPARKAFDVRDSFNKLKRNSDYAGAEFFSHHHLTYSKKAIGFGDFLTLGSAYTSSGGQPHAIALHLTYKNPSDDSIWVEHFVSDDTQKGVGSVGEKYLQAVRKVTKASRVRSDQFGNNSALEAYRIDDKQRTFPGLPKNKRRQIEHHLNLIYQILNSQL